MLLFTALLRTFRISISERLDSELGATAAEYALLMGFIAFAIIAGATAVGVNLNEFFNQQAATIANW